MYILCMMLSPQRASPLWVMKWITWALICKFEPLTQYSQKHERIANLERLLRGRTDCRGGNAMTIVAKVWIEEDCITCDACADICPEVFEALPCHLHDGQAGTPYLMQYLNAVFMQPRFSPDSLEAASWKVLKERWTTEDSV